MLNDDPVNFEVTFTNLQQNVYGFSVDSPYGQPNGSFNLPINDPAYKRMRANVRAGRPNAAETFGQWLFQELFKGNINATYRAATPRPNDNHRLRIFLMLDQSDHDIIALPWELLRDPHNGWLALHPKKPVAIVRYLRLPTSPTPKATSISLPLRILLTAAEPKNLPPIHTERELDAITKAWSRLMSSGLAEVAVEPHLTPETFERRIGEGFHVWHFVGHGTFLSKTSVTKAGDKKAGAGQLYFEDETGSAVKLSAEDIWLRLGGNALQLVVLNACRSGQLNLAPFRNLISALLRCGIPTVVGMQSDVLNTTAREFADVFYRELAQGWPIDLAMIRGQGQIARAYGTALPDWAMPVMYTRNRHCKLIELPSENDQPKARQQPAYPSELEQTLRYLIDIGVFRSLFVSRDWIQLIERQENGQSKVKQVLSRLPIVLLHGVSAENIHARTVDMIAYALVRASQEQIWLSETPIGAEGITALIESLRLGQQQDTHSLLPEESAELKDLRDLYVRVIDKLQHTIPPPIEPASDAYSDTYGDLLTELTDVWQRLPPGEGIFKCLEIVQIIPAVSRGRLLRSLSIMAPAICRFHPDIVEDIAAVAQRIVELFP